MHPEQVWLDFAEHVRITAGKITAAALAGRTQKVAELAGALCTAAADIKHRHLMADEASDPDRFDLAALASLPMAGPEVGE